MKRKHIAKIPRRTYTPPPTLAAAPWDQGASGPANQDGLIVQERGETDLTTGKVINPNRVFGKVRMPMVNRYHRQGKLTDHHLAAAQRLYAAYAGYPTRDPIAAITDRVDGAGDNDPNVMLLDKRREFYAIWKAIPPRCKPILEHVVLNDLAMGEMVGASKPEVAAEYWGKLTEGLEAVK